MKHKKKLIIIVKNENVFKNCLRPNFSCCPQKMGGSKIWGSPPFAPLNETKKDKLFLKQLRSSYLLG